MTDDSDEGFAGLERLRSLMVEVVSARPDRPDEAMMLLKEAYATFKSLPAEDRKQLNETFQLMAAEMDKKSKPRTIRLALRPAMTYLGLSPDHAATAQGLLDCYSETMWQGPTLRTNR